VSSSCDVCQKRAPEVALQRCGSCHVVFYCSQAHQKQAWPAHKPVCGMLRAARLKAAEERARLDKERDAAALKAAQAADASAGSTASDGSAASARVSTPITPSSVKPPAPLRDISTDDPESMFNRLKGIAAFEDAVANVTLMSRFAADFAPKNLHFAFNYWDEHADNFRQFLVDMLDQATLLKLAVSTVELMSQFNARYGWIPAEVMPAVKHGYDTLVRELATKDNRTLLLDAFAELFAVIGADIDNLEANPGLEYLYRHRVAPRLTRLFELCTGTDRMRAIERLLLPASDVDVSTMRRFWWPQFMLFATRFLDLYDQALQGRSVKDYNRLAALRGGLPPPPDEDEAPSSDEINDKPRQFLRQFGQPSYWTKRYETIAPNEPTFDWYVPWSRLVPYWEQHVGKLPSRGGPEPHVLYFGCGNSALPLDMHKDGLAFVWSTDRCEAVIAHMVQHVAGLGLKTLSYKAMDMTHTTYRNAAFAVVIEKATIDATMNCENALLVAHSMLAEVRRVLKIGGLFFSVSLGDRRLRTDVYKVDGFEIVDVHALEGSIIRDKKAPNNADTTPNAESSASSSSSAPAPAAADGTKRFATTYLWVLRKTHDRAAEVETLLKTAPD
jgi:hypothetical protein